MMLGFEAAFISIFIHHFLMVVSYFYYLLGSGLSVVGPRRHGRGSQRDDNGGRREPVDNIFRVAQNHGGEEPDGNTPHFSHTITMYQSGFTVDDGPYRMLDDPANAPFLENLASG